MTTPEILQSLQQGDNQALTAVYQQVSGYCIRTLLRKTTCSPEDAEDLLMDAILIFRDNILTRKLTQITNLKAYLFGICWNLWREKNRTQSKWEAAKSDLEHQILVMETQGELPFPGEELLEQKALIQQVQQALGKLGDRCQQLLKMVYVESRSHQEIAEAMNFSSANVVKVTRHRCYQQWVKHINIASSSAHES